MANRARVGGDRAHDLAAAQFPRDDEQGVKLSGADKQVALASWTQAVQRVQTKLDQSHYKRASKRLQSLRPDTFRDVTQTAEEALVKAQAKQSRSSATLQRICERINRYAVIGDLLVQHHAEYTSLVWGAFRFLLLAAVQEKKIGDSLTDSLDETLQVLLRADEYSKLYSHYSELENLDIFQSLQNNVTHLYESVLFFLLRAVCFFEDNTLKEVVRHFHSIVDPFESRFEPLLGEIKSLESHVEKAVAALERSLKIRQENFTWLKTVDYDSDVSQIFSERLEGTCEWFFERQEYRNWASGTPQGSLLFCTGKPGSGKSVIASQTIRRNAHQPGRIIAFVLCKEGDEAKGKLESILCGIMSQILAQAENRTSLHSLVQSYRSSQNSIQPSLLILWSLLRSMCATIQRFCCIIDGFDECDGSDKQKVDFLENLTALSVSEDGIATHKLMIFSRLEFSTVKTSALWKTIAVTDSDTQNDIELYVTSALNSSHRLNNHPQKDNIFQYLTKNASGMILWVKLMVSELEIGHRNIERILDSVPKGLTDVYTTILGRFSRSETNSQIEQALAIISIVLACAQPLSVNELAVALALWDETSPASSKVSDVTFYDTEEITDAVSRAAPLVVVTLHSTVELVHASLKRFLLQLKQIGASERSLTMQELAFDEGRLHYQILVLICGYLTLDRLHVSLDTGKAEDQIRHLHEYACRHLIYHTARSTPTEAVIPTICQYFDSPGAWRWLYAMKQNYKLPNAQLQILQSEFRQMISHTSPVLKSNQQYDLLVYLAKKRYNQLHRGTPNAELQTFWAQSLAEFLDLEGQWAAAEKLQLELLREAQSAAGPEDIFVLQISDDLASTYANQGRWVEAEQLQQQVVDAITKIRPSDHHQVLQSKNGLAIYKEQLYKLDEAQTLHEEVLQIKRLSLDQDNISLISNYNNLAAVSWKKGKIKEAAAYYLAIEAIFEKFPVEMGKPDNLPTLRNLAINYRRAGILDKAENYANKATALAQRILGREHHDTLSTQLILSGIYESQNRFQESEKLAQHVADLFNRTLGPENIKTLSARHNLAVFLYNRDKVAEAEEIQREVVEIKRRTLGNGDSATLASLTSLAGMYNDMGRRSESETLLEQIIPAQKKLVGEYNQDIVYCMAQLAKVKNDMAKYNEAITLQERVVDLQSQFHGEEHPGTLTWKHTLSVYLYNAGRLSESAKVEEGLLQTRIAKLGLEHPDVLNSKHSQMITYHLQGNLKESERVGVEALDVARRSLGNDSSVTLMLMRTLAEIYRAQASLNLAEQLGKEVLEARQRILGLERSETVTSIVELGKTYRMQGRYEESRELGVRAMKLRERVDGKDHPFMFIGMFHQARTLRDMGQLEDALELAHEAFQSLKKFYEVVDLDTDNLDVLRSMSTLASIYYEQGKLDEAMELRKNVLSGKKRALGEAHFEIMAAKSNLAAIYNVYAGKRRDAQKLVSDAAEAQMQALGANHPSRMHSLSILARIYSDQGKYEDAIALEKQVLQGRREMLGAEHPKTKQSEQTIIAYENQA